MGVLGGVDFGLELRSGAGVSRAICEGEGPTVLCLHGFPDNCQTFHAQLPAFVGAGFRVVCPMLPGYETSSLERGGAHYLSDVALDVLDWMGQLGVERVHLVGHDWGALIGMVVAAMAPERVMSLTTLAIPHLGRLPQGLVRVPRQFVASWYILFFQLPWFSDWWVRRGDLRFLEWLWGRWSPGWRWDEEMMKQVKQTFSAPGVLEASLSYYRCLAEPVSAKGRESWRLLREPPGGRLLALTGALDGCMDTRMFDVSMSVKEGSGLSFGRVERVEEAGHFLHQERPEIVNRLVLGWLEESLDG